MRPCQNDSSKEIIPECANLMPNLIARKRFNNVSDIGLLAAEYGNAEQRGGILPVSSAPLTYVTGSGF
jgi:hypothetical protein